MLKVRFAALILLGGLLACALLATPSVVKSYQQQQGFDDSLEALGIEPSLAGVQTYIQKVVQPGISHAELLRRLAPIGVVGKSGVNLPICEDIALFLLHTPGNQLPFLPIVPPTYQVHVCYSGGLVSRVDAVRLVLSQ